MGAADIGMVGLGVMGANLALNMAENGFTVAIHDTDDSRIRALKGQAFSDRFIACPDPQSLIDAIRPPRPVLMLVPAGQAVDAVIAALSPLMSPGDILIDAGNSDFHDTRRRTATQEARGLAFLGMGVSGGAAGARTGPAIMAGGSPQVWERVRPILTKIAAHYGDDPCADHYGPDGAGHFVKTVHNGVEYADMQMIAEVYGLMRDGMGLSAPEIGDRFATWGTGVLSSYLMEIAAEVAMTEDPETSHPLLDVIADIAGQKGTGRWSAIEGLKVGAVASAIEAAVGARNLSADAGARAAFAGLGRPDPQIEIAGDDLADALLSGRIIAYSQGFDLLARASSEYGWSLPLHRIALGWRAGCIIRSALLNDMAAALEEGSGSGAPLAATAPLSEMLARALPGLRRVVGAGVSAGLPVPALSAALSWRDQLAQPRGTANMLQGLRDRFGQHGFARTDRPGKGFHGPW